MFKRNFSRNRNGHGTRRFGGPKPFGRQNGGGNRGFARGRRIKSVDISLLVKKAVQTEAQEYISQNTFENFALNDKLKNNVKARGYTTPTPIQDQTIPQVLEGRDVVGIANTGTGKTAAFLLPLLHKIANQRSKKALIVAPTRELAVQIQDECHTFSYGLNIASQLCIGGASMYHQKNGLRRNPEFVIGTPGRLKDLHNQRALNFADYDTIILDEVDRMLDMGFIHDVRHIISFLPQNRQSLFFSATLSPQIQGLITQFAKDPVFISVKSQETSHNVDQDIVRLNGRQKTEVLDQLLRQEGFSKVLVFGRTKWGIEKLSKQLALQGHKVAALHGNKNQNQRQRALDEFKRDRINILLATDIASRGLDISDITHVINYDLPETYEDYVHRIGRTGRADKKGIALSFVD